ncbi:MAG: Sir2 family NAD-dependent protein deacetylase [Thermoplasmata archaeon]
MAKLDNSSDEFRKRIEKAASLILSSKHFVCFTGAGISTESGIPDYRGPDGVWTRKDKGLPPPVWKVPPDKVKPNRGHYALVELQNRGILKFLISQNVDNLHLRSGIKPELIAEFHGNSQLFRCLSCDRSFPKDEVWDENKWGDGYRTSPVREGQPVCPSCGGRIISSVVNFGDPIWPKELRLSEYHSSNADVYMVVGSSLTVTPAANMPLLSLEKGGQLIIINRSETPLDRWCKVRFFESAGEVLEEIVKEITNRQRS